MKNKLFSKIMEGGSDYNCPEWNRDYNDGNRVKLVWPACNDFVRWKEWFEELKYVCGNWLEDWHITQPDGNIGHTDLDYMTERSENKITIYIQNESGRKFRITVNKHKTFKVLMAIIRVKLFKAEGSRDGMIILRYYCISNIFWHRRIS